MTEVLAPAGTSEAFNAAVLSGADAVYFGAGSFNARRNAKNFTDEEMRRCVEFARIRGVKTYLTLNTLTANSELSAALAVAEKAAEIGVDALIVQDLGLIRLLRRHLPNMPLHASTQMSVHSADALRPLAEMGFERVVIARECDKSTISSICKTAKELGMEVEAFIHGALCMCLSGQCYLSSLLGGRSGNRGLCAQPCRLPFAVSGGTGNDLSLKDMSLISHIGEMADMGVTSFKIEGRMKRPEYVAAAVTAVRAAADGKAVPSEVSELLSGLFSRSGHTDGYYFGKTGRDMFGIRTDADEKLAAKSINAAHELYRRETGRVVLSAEFEALKDKPFCLTLSDGRNTVSVSGTVPRTAESRPLCASFVAEKLQKSGGTPYTVEHVGCRIGDGLSVGGSELNAAKREAFEKMSALRAAADRTRLNGSTVSSFSLPDRRISNALPKRIARFARAEQLCGSLDGLSAIILPVECDFEAVKHCDIPVLAELPRGVMHSTAKYEELLTKAKQSGVRAAVCGNLAAFETARRVGIATVADFGMNIYNTVSLEAVAEMGASAAALSFEMSLSQAVRCGTDMPKGIISYGRLPLMLFKNCPGKNGRGCKECGGHCELSDRKGISFPVMCRGEFSELFNSRPVWMFDRRAEMRGLDFEILYFTDEAPERCARVLTLGTSDSSPDVDFTRGLYYREVF